MVSGGKRENSGRKPSDKKQINKRVSKEARDHLALLSDRYSRDETYILEQCILQTKKLKIED